MRKLTGTIVLCLAILALSVAGCGGGSNSSGGTSNELDLGPSNFVQTSITLNAGEALHIVDSQSTGGTHNLCLGQSGQCGTSSNGPSELHSPGMMFSPGMTKDITFSAAGTYHITCTIHPSMNLTITVQ
jgi:plastocyanin